MDFVDVDSEKWKAMARLSRFPWNWLYQRETAKTTRLEAELANEFDRSIVVSEREAQLFQERIDGAKLNVVRNGVDVDYYDAACCDNTRSTRPTLVFTGMMDYFPNVDAMVHFCGEVLPRLRRSVPDVRLLIVGRSPTREVRELARNGHVTVTGEVPDVRPYLCEAWLSIAPFRIARGVQNKVLEAMAMGLPVVGTSLAFQGIHADEKSGIHTANSPDEIAASASKLLLDSEFREHAAKRARAFVARHYNWKEQAGKLESILNELVR
jgi:sugar transferase (PEP-CTERM/EpsH1 system associated)